MDNTVWMIGDKSSQRFFNAERGNFDSKITFSSFYPSKYDCEATLNNIVSRSSRHKYAIVEAEILRFDGKELIVSYDDSFREESLQNISLY